MMKKNRPNIFKLVILLAVAIFLISGITTYFAARKTRIALVELMKRDAISLANIFVEGAWSIYKSQVTSINDLRARLMVYGRLVEENDNDLAVIPPEMAYAVLIDSTGTIKDETGIMTPQVRDWLSELDELAFPVLSGEKNRMFFGLNPEFPIATGPVGYVRRNGNHVLLIFSYPPFGMDSGIGFLARQLAQTPSVRYIFLQSERGILIGSKDVYRAYSIDSEPFLQKVLDTKHPDVRFIEFQGESVFELAYLFPQMGRFKGVLRIGLPLSEYRELSAIVLWTIGIGSLLALLAIVAIIALGIVVSKIVKLRREHENLGYLQSLGEIAASVAHEIRNPLNAVNMSLQRVEAEFEPRRDIEEYSKILSSAREQVGRIDDIVREFIAVAGNISPIRTKIGLMDLLNSIIDDFDASITAKNIEVIREMKTNNEINVDTAKISRALGNIFKNAIEATPRNGRIEISSEIMRNELCLKIFNEGNPIPEDMLDKILEPFISEKSSGTGIGLFYAYRIIDAHGGKISVRNISDGVEFDVRLQI